MDQEKIRELGDAISFGHRREYLAAAFADKLYRLRSPLRNRCKGEEDRRVEARAAVEDYRSLVSAIEQEAKRKGYTEIPEAQEILGLGHRNLAELEKVARPLLDELKLVDDGQ